MELRDEFKGRSICCLVGFGAGLVVITTRAILRRLYAHNDPEGYLGVVVDGNPEIGDVYDHAYELAESPSPEILEQLRQNMLEREESVEPEFPLSF